MFLKKPNCNFFFNRAQRGLCLVSMEHPLKHISKANNMAEHDFNSNVCDFLVSDMELCNTQALEFWVNVIISAVF